MNRRDFLGAAAVSAAATAAVISPAIGFVAAGGQWYQLKAAFDAAKLAYDNVHHDDPRCEDLADVYSRALDRLLKCPAPDYAALEWKLNHFADVSDDSIIERQDINIIQRDVRALLKGI